MKNKLKFYKDLYARRSTYKKVYKNFDLENKIVFDCYHGRNFDCNIRAYYDYIIKNDLFKKFRITIVSNYDGNLSGLKIVPNRIYKFVKYDSAQYIDEILTAKIVIMNSILPQWIPTNPKEQIIINTWHGGGNYKTFGMVNPQEKDYLFFRLCKKQYTKYLIDNKSAIKSTKKALLLKKNQFLNIGYPRIDEILNGVYTKSNLSKILRKTMKFNEHDNVLYVLYAPTYRSPEKGKVIKLDDFAPDFGLISLVLRRKFSVDKVVFIYHGHRYDNTDIYKINCEDPKTTIYDSSIIPDFSITQLIIATDVLITDYSSIIWDYSFTRKPIFRFCKDYENYTKYRGFFNEIPLKPCRTDGELVNEIVDYENIKQLETFCLERLKLGSFENGNACEKLTNFILKKLDIDKIKTKRK